MPIKNYNKYRTKRANNGAFLFLILIIISMKKEYNRYFYNLSLENILLINLVKYFLISNISIYTYSNFLKS